MIKKIRRQFEGIRQKKRHCFDDFDPIVKACLRFYADLFPKRRITKHGSKVVYHFESGDLNPISLEKEHGSREYVPHRYAKFAIVGIEELITYIERNVDEAHQFPEEGQVEKDLNEQSATKEIDNAREEDIRVLPESKIPDGDSGG